VSAPAVDRRIRLPRSVSQRVWGASSEEFSTMNDDVGFPGPGSCGRQNGSWRWTFAECDSPLGLHSRVEADGWVIDGSNGRARPVMVMRVEPYRREIWARNIGRRIGCENGELVGLADDAAETAKGFAHASPARVQRRDGRM
jgi:hypothetical protein